MEEEFGCEAPYIYISFIIMFATCDNAIMNTIHLDYKKIIIITSSYQRDNLLLSRQMLSIHTKHPSMVRGSF